MKKIISILFILLVICFIPQYAKAIVFLEVPPTPTPTIHMYEITPNPDPTWNFEKVPDGEPTPEDEYIPEDPAPDESGNDPSSDSDTPVNEGVTGDTSDSGNWFEDLFNISSVKDDNPSDSVNDTQSPNASTKFESWSIKKCLSPFWLWFLIGTALFFFLAFLVMLILFLLALANTSPEKKKVASDKPNIPELKK